MALGAYESRGAVPQNAPTRGLRDLNPPRPTVTHRDDAPPTGLARPHDATDEAQ